MSQKRSLTGFLVASLGLAAGLAVMASPDLASAGADCSKLKITEVKSVCEKGGEDAVKSAMKKAVQKAKAKDASLTCQTCHGENNALKGDADAKFKELGMKDGFGAK